MLLVHSAKIPSDMLVNPQQFRGFFVAMSAGAALAMCVLGLGFLEHIQVKQAMKPPAKATDPPRSVPADASADVPALNLQESDPALRYVRALQEGNWTEAIEMTQWMRDRLEYLEAQGGNPQDLEKARQDFTERLMTKTVEGNQLRPEGIEDQYILKPGVTLEPALKDKGRDDLETPAAYRVWFRVGFPQQAVAVRDEEGAPLKSLLVGVNISESGQVLKAGVAGNLEIDYGSTDYGW